MRTTHSISTHVFRIDGMHCGSCALPIDDALHDLPGVHDTRTSVKHRRTTVELDTSHSSTNDVVTAIAELGYRASELE